MNRKLSVSSIVKVPAVALRLLARVFSFVLLFLVITLIIILAGAAKEGYQVFAVKSGSMEPAIAMGSLIFTQPSSSYGLSDVITFKPTATSSIRVTHQIVGIEKQLNENAFVTQGLANPEEDEAVIPQSLVIGKVIMTMPLIGYVPLLLQTKVGILALLVLPCVAILTLTSLDFFKHSRSFLLKKNSSQ